MLSFWLEEATQSQDCKWAGVVLHCIGALGSSCILTWVRGTDGKLSRSDLFNSKHGFRTWDFEAVLWQLQNCLTAAKQRHTKRRREVFLFWPLITWTWRWRYAASLAIAVSTGIMSTHCLSALILWIISQEWLQAILLTPLSWSDSILLVKGQLHCDIIKFTTPFFFRSLSCTEILPICLANLQERAFYWVLGFHYQWLCFSWTKPGSKLKVNNWIWGVEFNLKIKTKLPLCCVSYLPACGNKVLYL